MKKPITDYLVSPEDAIIKVMACLDHNTSGIALVVDHDGRLIGTVTDGDIRRALLKGAGLDSPIQLHMGRRFTSVSAEIGRAEVLDLMRSRYIEQVPIVDQGGKIVGLHVMREIIGCTERPNCAVIMAGGRGERLRPLTDTIPKPMICIAGRPILERLVLHLVGCGIRDVFLSINYLGHVIQKHFGDGERFGCRIRYLQEEKPLHTGGALALLPEKPTTPLLVMNGDLITDVDVGAMLDYHDVQKHKITVGTNKYTHMVPFGCLEIDGMRVCSIQEKPVLIKHVNAGIYVLDPSVLDWIPQNQAFPITGLIEHALDAHECVGAFPVVDWVDVGGHDQLKQASGTFRN